MSNILKNTRFPKVKDIEKHYYARKAIEVHVFRDIQLFCIIEYIFFKNKKDILNFRYIKEKISEYNNIKKLFKNGIRKWIKANNLTPLYQIISKEEKDKEGNVVIEEYLIRTGNGYLKRLFSDLKKDIVLLPFPEQCKKKSSFIVPFNWVFANDNIIYKDSYERKEVRTGFKSEINYDTLSESLIKLKNKKGIDKQEYHRKLKYFNYIKREIRKYGISNNIYLTGSLYTQLGLKNSDLDICILTECKEDSKGILEKLKVIFTNLGMKNIVINYAVHTKVCLCTFFDEKEQIDVDISINCEGLLKNVQLFKICDVIDERFRVLVIAIKYWIKQRGIDKGNTVDRMINSYSYILLLIYFLQIQQPPILPNVESIKDLLKERNEHDKNLMESEMFWFKDQEQENKIIKNQLNFPCTNKNNVGRLLVDYFEYFGFEFNYENDVISSRLGHSLTKKEKHWEKSLMCIEDPIYSDINKGNILYPWCYEGIINEFKLAFIKTTEFQKDFIQEVCQPLKEFNYLPPLIYPPIDKFYKRQLLENYVKTLKD